MGHGQKRAASSMNDERWERRLNIDTAARTFEEGGRCSFPLRADELCRA